MADTAEGRSGLDLQNGEELAGGVQSDLLVSAEDFAGAASHIVTWRDVLFMLGGSGITLVFTFWYICNFIEWARKKALEEAMKQVHDLTVDQIVEKAIVAIAERRKFMK